MEALKVVIVLVASFIALTSLVSSDAITGFNYEYEVGFTNETNTFPSFEQYENQSNDIVYNDRGWIRLNDEATSGYYLSDRFSNDDNEPFELLYAIADARVDDGVLNLTIETSDYPSFNESLEEEFSLVNSTQELDLQAENQTYYRFRVDLES